MARAKARARSTESHSRGVSIVSYSRICRAFRQLKPSILGSHLLPHCMLSRLYNASVYFDAKLHQKLKFHSGRLFGHEFFKILNKAALIGQHVANECG